MPCFPSRRVTAAALAVGLAAGVPSLLQGQASPVPAAAAIHGLAEPEESLIVLARSPLTGLVTFASTAGQGLLLPFGKHSRDFFLLGLGGNVDGGDRATNQREQKTTAWGGVGHVHPYPAGPG